MSAPFPYCGNLQISKQWEKQQRGEEGEKRAGIKVKKITNVCLHSQKCFKNPCCVLLHKGKPNLTCLALHSPGPSQRNDALRKCQGKNLGKCTKSLDTLKIEELPGIFAAFHSLQIVKSMRTPFFFFFSGWWKNGEGKMTVRKTCHKSEGEL